MYYRIKHHRLPILLLFISLTCPIALTAQSLATSARFRAGSVLRLRLRVENKTLRSDETTKVFVEFLDRDYEPVPNDGTREIELAQAPTGSGHISQERITVRPGDWRGEVTFTPRHPGKLVITARSNGLDSAQTLVLVTQRQASFLSRLFETVAYAQPQSAVEFSPKTYRSQVAADNKARAIFQIHSAPSARVVIATNLSSGGVVYEGKTIGSSLAEITLDETGISGDIGIFSATPGKVEVKASVLQDGPTDSTEITFVPPKPSKVMLKAPETISSGDRTVPIWIEMTDDGGLVLSNDQERSIRLMSNDEGSVTFEPERLVFPMSQRSAQSLLHLKNLPLGNEIRLLAVVEGDNGLQSVPWSIIIKSSVERLLITGPHEINPRTEAEFTVRLANKENKPKEADRDRKIDLAIETMDAGMGRGQLTPTQVMINKGEDHAVVKYRSPSSVGKFMLTATSPGLENYKHEIRAVTAIQWLVLIALFGGAIGGVTRLLQRDYKRNRSLSKRTGRSLSFDLRKILGSVVSGLFLYLTIKLGLGQLSGLQALPASLDLGSKLVAFFFGGLGGFAGLVIMHKLVARLLKLSPWSGKAAAPGSSAPDAPSASASAKSPAI